MKLSNLFETLTKDFKFVYHGLFKDRIILTKKGFKSSTRETERFILSNLKKFEGYVGEIQLDYDSYDDVSMITNIHVVEDMRRKGYAKELYNEALRLSKKKGKLGIASYDYMRTGEGSEAFWKKYGQKYDEDRELDIITREV